MSDELVSHFRDFSREWLMGLHRSEMIYEINTRAGNFKLTTDDLIAAADRIEALEAENAELKALLGPCRDLARCVDVHAETQAIERICKAVEAIDAVLTR